MPWIKHAAQMWLNRQYRMNYRAAMNGLLASGRFTEFTQGELHRHCHQLSFDAIKQFRVAAKLLAQE